MSASVAEYLVSHGCTAALSRCRDEVGIAPDRGDRVVIASARGLELGEVLCQATKGHALLSPNITSGKLLRQATPDDEAAATTWSRRASALLDDAQQLIESEHLPLLPLDVECLLDGTQAVVHVLRWDACTLTPFLEKLRQKHGLLVTLADMSHAEPEHEHDEHGCGSCGEGGCGSCGEGGCSTGGCGSDSCSSGSIKSADDLTAYFSQLREQMHAAIPRVPLM